MLPRLARPPSCGTSCSMRSVIMKPPTMLMVAQVTAMEPRMVLTLLKSPPAATSEPTSEMPGDGVGAGHERRVQQLRHLRDDLVADEAGEHEDVEPEEQFLRHLRGSFGRDELAATLELHDLAPVGDDAALGDLVVEVDLERAVAEQVEEELLHVARVHLARVDRDLGSAGWWCR